MAEPLRLARQLKREFEVALGLALQVTGQVHSKDPSPVARAIVAGLAMAERS